MLCYFCFVVVMLVFCSYGERYVSISVTVNESGKYDEITIPAE